MRKQTDLRLAVFVRILGSCCSFSTLKGEMGSILKNLFFVLVWKHGISQNFPQSPLNYYPRLLAPIHETSSLFPYQTRPSLALQRVQRNPTATLNSLLINRRTTYFPPKPSIQFGNPRWNTQNVHKVTPENFGKETKLQVLPPSSNKRLLLPVAPPANFMYSSKEKQSFANSQLPKVVPPDSKRAPLAQENQSNNGKFKPVIIPLQPKEVLTSTRTYSNIPITHKPVSLRANEINRNRLIPSSETRRFQNERTHGTFTKVPPVLNSGHSKSSNNIPLTSQGWSPKVKSTIYTNPSSAVTAVGNKKPFTDDKLMLYPPKMHELNQASNLNDKPQILGVTKLNEEHSDISPSNVSSSHTNEKLKHVEILKELNEKHPGISLSTEFSASDKDENEMPDIEREHFDLETTTNAPSEQPEVTEVHNVKVNEEFDLPVTSKVFDNEVIHTSNETLLEALKSSISGTPEEIRMLKIVDAINNFGLNLYHRLQNNTNIFFSPLSLSEVMAIILEGATNMTATQLMNGLHFSTSNIRQDEIRLAFEHLVKSIILRRSNYEFENANLILLKNNCPFKSEFSSNVYKYYKPLLGSVDFASYSSNIMRSVNDWVTRHTHGKINEFLKEPLSPSTVLAVLNVVYFRGKWKNPFHQSSTYSDTFYNHGYQPVQVSMMLQSTAFATAYSSSLNARAIELLYHGEEVSMVILLPERRDKIQQLHKNLNYHSLNDILSSMRRRPITLSLPKFSLQIKYDMENIFKEMGMKEMFVPGKASFGKMTNTTGLYVSNLYHEGAIDVDEKGTEAAAVTGISIMPLSAREIIKVNHPFVFLIRNKINGLILFIGQFTAF